MTDKQKAMDRILKLLKTASPDSGATEGEAHNAMVAAKIMMAKHSIAMHELSEAAPEDIPYTTIEIDSFNRRISIWERQLAVWVEKNCPRVKVLSHRSVQAKHDYIRFIGEPNDIKTAETLYKSMLVELVFRACESDSFKGHNLQARPGKSYCVGYVDGLYDRTRAATIPNALVVRTQAIVASTKAKFEEWLEESNTKVRKGRRSRASLDTDTYLRGKSDAQTKYNALQE